MATPTTAVKAPKASEVESMPELTAEELIEQFEAETYALTENAPIPENRVGTNLVLVSGAITPFVGHMPSWDPNRRNPHPWDWPNRIAEAACIIDLSTAVIKAVQLTGYAQPRFAPDERAEYREGKGRYAGKGQREVPWQIQGEVQYAMAGGIVGWILADGSFRPHPMLNKESAAAEQWLMYHGRALEAYTKGPFRSFEVESKIKATDKQVLSAPGFEAALEPYERLRKRMAAGNFVARNRPTRANQVASERIPLFSIEAPSSASNLAGGIVERQARGVPCTSLTLSARSMDRWREVRANDTTTVGPKILNSDTGQATVRTREFLDPFFSLRTNMEWVAHRRTHKEDPNPNTGAVSSPHRLGTAITGMDQGGFPERATLVGVSWLPVPTKEDIEAHEVAVAEWVKKKTGIEVVTDQLRAMAEADGVVIPTEEVNVDFFAGLNTAANTDEAVA